MVDKEVNKRQGPVNRGKMKISRPGKIEQSKLPGVRKDRLQKPLIRRSIIKLNFDDYSKTTIGDTPKSKPSSELKNIETSSSITADEKVKPETKVPHNRGVHYRGYV